jgi:HAD superfamily phosphoserine phosphatase-like hydrolase
MTTFVASDLEGTLSAGEMWRAIGEYLKANGAAGPYRRFFLGRMPGFFASKLGLVDSQAFKNDWFVRLARFCAGWTREQAQAMADAVVDTALWPQRRNAVVDALASQHDAGATLVIVSGGLEPVVEAFAQRLRAQGLNRTIQLSTIMAMTHDRYTGGLATPVCTGTQKVARLKALTGTVLRAYGDTGADIPMLSLAQAGVAVAPDKKLAAEAARRGWQVIPA